MKGTYKYETLQKGIVVEIKHEKATCVESYRKLHILRTIECYTDKELDKKNYDLLCTPKEFDHV